MAGELFEARKRLRDLQRIGDSIPKDYASQDMYLADLRKAEEDVRQAEKDALQIECVSEAEMEL